MSPLLKCFIAVNFVGVLLTPSVQCYARTQKLESRNTDADIKYYVFTRENAKNPQAIEPDVESVIRNVFNPLRPTTISVHGLGGSRDAPENAVVVDTKLAQEDANVIVVDYGALPQNKTEEYVATAQVVGAAIADFLILLQQHFDVKFAQVHLVGFSLGAQIAGFAGKQIYARTGEKVQRVTALDPAGSPYENLNSTAERLTADDALFVDVIHTNGGELGYFAPCGHADFYPNGGRQQPDCSAADRYCSHKRAFEFVAEMWSPQNDFIVTRCGSTGVMSLQDCWWVNVKMGDHVQTPGVYYLETKSVQPYAKGSGYAFL